MVSSTFQDKMQILISYCINHFLSINATILVSKNRPIFGEPGVIIFVTK